MHDLSFSPLTVFAIAAVCFFVGLGLVTIFQPREVIVPDGWKRIFPNAGETFFARSPQAGAVCDIEVEGTCQYHSRGLFFDTILSADAFYRAYRGRFEQLHRELLVDNQPLPKDAAQYEVLKCDRANHAYKLRIDLGYSGEQVGIAFGRANKPHPNLGFLLVRVTPLPEGTPGIADRRKEEQKRFAAEQHRLAEKQKAAAEAEWFARAIERLSICAKTHRNLGDPEYREHFARAHSDELIGNQGTIRADASALLEEPRIMQHLLRHHPEALNVAFGPLEMLLLAERNRVDKALAAAEAALQEKEPALQEKKPLEIEPSDRKETPEEWRARQLRHAQTQLEDRLAKDLLAIETVLRREDLLDQQKAAVNGRTDLTDEERRNRVEVINAVAAVLRRNPNGGGDDATDAPKDLQIIE